MQRKDRPDYIVVAKDGIEKTLENANVIRKGSKKRHECGCTIVERGGRKSDILMFEKLGACAADLTQNQLDKLKNNDATVFVNQVRSVSEPTDSTGEEFEWEDLQNFAFSGGPRPLPRPGPGRPNRPPRRPRRPGSGGPRPLPLLAARRFPNRHNQQFRNKGRRHVASTEANLNDEDNEWDAYEEYAMRLRSARKLLESLEAEEYYLYEEEEFQLFDTPHHSWGLQAIGIHEAYKGQTGKGATVAVLDTGLASCHPDFPDDQLSEKKWKFRNFLSGAEKIYKDLLSRASVADGHGHGTQCCGIIAGPLRPGNYMRRYSVAPDCTLMVGKVLDDSGKGWDSEIIRGIQWALDGGADVISLSLGSYRSQDHPSTTAYEEISTRLLMSGKSLLIGAAGNYSDRSSGVVEPVSDPAATAECLSIGAIDSWLSIANFSCGQTDQYGVVNFVAPGVGVFCPTIGFRKYTYGNGTSMATPHVAGVAALYVEKFPDLSAHDLWHRMESDAYSLGSPSDYGRGIPQAPR